MMTGERVAAVGQAARRRRPHLMLACVVAGLALSPAGALAVAILAVFAAVVAVLGFGRLGGGTAIALVFGAAVLGTLRIAAIDRPARAAPPGTVIDANATLLDTPRPTRFGSSATMQIDSGPARDLRVLARVESGSWPPDAGPGLRVRMRALVRDPRGRARDQRAAPATANLGAPGTPGS